MDQIVAPAQPAAPIVLELPQQPLVVRAAVSEDSSSDGLKGPRRGSALGSPVRETRPPGSAGGGRYKSMQPQDRPLPTIRTGDTQPWGISPPQSMKGGGRLGAGLPNDSPSTEPGQLQTQTHEPGQPAEVRPVRGWHQFIDVEVHCQSLSVTSPCGLLRRQDGAAYLTGDVRQE